MSVAGGIRTYPVIRGLARMAALVLCLWAPVASQATLIWDSNLGSALTVGNFMPSSNDGLQTYNLGTGYGFNFEGTTYTSIIVATSGFVWLGGQNGSQCCVLSNETTTLNDFANNAARIAPAWTDLLPGSSTPSSGSVDVNEITDALGARTDVTFYQVATDSSDLTPVSFQLQLFASGVIVFSYQHFDSTMLGSNPAALIGLTNGPLGTPTAVDFTNLPFATSGGSVYDYLTTSPGFNLTGQSIVFTPIGSTGNFEVTPAFVTPEPATLLPVAIAIFLLMIIGFRKKRIT